MASDPRCSNGACHGNMNTLGLPFETYNHAGFLRADDHGNAPNGSTTLTNAPDPDKVTMLKTLTSNHQGERDHNAQQDLQRGGEAL